MASVSLHLLIPAFLLITNCLIFNFARTTQESDAHENHWVVDTTSGPVEGTVSVGFENQEVYAFYGIPYAEPPTGQNRFKPPRPVKQWTELFKAVQKPTPCYQVYTPIARKYFGNGTALNRRPWSEDCLTLNIWVPKPRIQDAPVLVYFHAGFFYRGTNNYPDGSTLSAYAQDVVVSMNYRLGAFGFLSLNLPDVPGNVGLLDQQLALRWIHENIHRFGGKTKAVILVGGEDAGGASVGYHLLSPGSNDLFRTAFLMSGAPTCSWAFQQKKDSLKSSRLLVEYLGCHMNTSDEEMACLRDAHPEDIVDANLFIRNRYQKYFWPTVDGTFMTESPLDALKAGRYNKAPVLLGSNAHEGSVVFALMNEDHVPDLDKGIGIEGFRRALKKIRPDFGSSLLSIVEEFYLDECNPEDILNIRDQAIQLYGDVIFDCCMNQFADYLAPGASVVYRGIDDIRKGSDPSWVGSRHGISMDYIFGLPLTEPGYSEAERKLTVEFMGWVNDHTRKRIQAIEDVFPRYTVEDKKYVQWDMEGPKNHSHYRELHCNLWNNVIPMLKEREETCKRT